MVKPRKSSSERIKALRNLIRERGIDAYLIPRADEFQGEFVAPYAQRLEWLTGFTGSAGIAVVMERKALVLTDPRYALQIDSQIDSKIFKAGDYTKKPLAKWIADNMRAGQVLGYDPYLHTPKQIDEIKRVCGASNIAVKSVKGNLIDAIWDDQPSKPNGKAVLFPDKVAGRKRKQKATIVAEAISAHGAYACVLSAIDSIAWLLNIRGSDVDCIPGVLSYVIVCKDGQINWIVDEAKVKGLDIPDVRIGDITQIDSAIEELADFSRGRPVLIDEETIPNALKKAIEREGVDTVHAKDPTIHPRSIKTPSEIAAIKAAHILDGVALVKFLKWVEDETPKGNIDEVDIDAALQTFRGQHSAYQGASFPTIAGFGANGAIVHYRATEGEKSIIQGDGLLLVDSGGQYAKKASQSKSLKQNQGENVNQIDNAPIYGTTDITRTLAIGIPTSEMCKNFTRVLKGHITLADAKFPKGTTGAQIDTLARKPLWDQGLNFAHGTGHGVGCYLAVHEDAANISPRGTVAFAPGMLISNEPGYYKAGEYGIRIENLVLVVERGDMLGFETISYAPFDRSLIEKRALSPQETLWLNAYHDAVYDNLSPYLDDAHREWLKAKTAAL